MAFHFGLDTFGGPIVLAIVVIWVLFWKGFSLWHSARNGQNYWFIALLVVNSIGLLGIVYLFFFRKDRKKIDIFGRNRSKVRRSRKKRK